MKLPQRKNPNNESKIAKALLGLAAVSAIIALGALGFYLRSRYVRWTSDADATQERIEELQSQVDELKEAAANFNAALSESSDATAEAQKRADLAHDRIEYYRDVLHIVAKTCPGRMRLPWLHGDPGHPEETAR